MFSSRMSHQSWLMMCTRSKIIRPPSQLFITCAQVMKSCEGGLMIFDLVHIINHDWWDILEENMKVVE